MIMDEFVSSNVQAGAVVVGGGSAVWGDLLGKQANKARWTTIPEDLQHEDTYAWTIDEVVRWLQVIGCEGAEGAFRECAAEWNVPFHERVRVAGCSQIREFVLPDDDQVLPEFLVYTRYAS